MKPTRIPALAPAILFGNPSLINSKISRPLVRLAIDALAEPLHLASFA